MKDQLSFCLLIPTLNEVIGLREILPQIDRSLFKEIIVVDGNSTDGTPKYCLEQGLTVLQQPGKGVPDAEEYGFLNSKSDVIITFTPDGNSLPELLPLICEKMKDGNDMVIVSRYADGAKSYDDDFFTSIGNFAFTSTVNILFNARYTDVLVGYRAYTRSAVERMKLVGMDDENFLRKKFYHLNSWETGSSIRAARTKLKVVEIPGDEPKRIGGVRKMSIIYNGLGTLFQIIYDFLFFIPNHSRISNRHSEF